MRLGLLTASEMKHIITPTLKIASNDKTRMHLYELLAQRISQYVEPQYISDDMLRGKAEEIEACAIYHQNYAKVDLCGFITNDRWGFTIGYSPDGLVGDDGLIEIKSRCQKYQIQTITDNAPPPEYLMQLQTGLLVSERKWIDFISYSNGLPMLTLRVYPDEVVQTAIIEAAANFEAGIAEKHKEYKAAFMPGARLMPTERKEFHGGEIIL